MTLIQSHVHRCRHDHNVLCATLGVGGYGLLALGVLVYSALAAVWP